MASPLINGVAVVWADIVVSFLGAPLAGIREINYMVKQEKTNNYGAGTEPVSRGYGRKTYEGSMKLLAEELRNIRRATPTGDITKIPFFDIIVIFINESTGLQEKVTLKAVDFTENNFGSSEGDTMIEIDVPFIYAGQTQEIV